MKESHGKGPASHPGPESCDGDRKAAAEALTGENADQVLSCEIKQSGAPTLLTCAEGNTGGNATGELPTGPAQSETLCMRGHSLHGNREVPPTPAEVGTTGRLEKATSRTSSAHVGGKSDRLIVPKKLPNKGATKVAPAEVVEERGLTKGNIGQTAVPRTQSRTRTSNGLAGVRSVARTDKRARFTALLHHVTVDLLRESFYALKRQASPGVDGMTWAQYEVDLEDRLGKVPCIPAVCGESDAARDVLDRVEVLDDPLVGEHPGETDHPVDTGRCEGVSQRWCANEFECVVDTVRHDLPHPGCDGAVVDDHMVDSGVFQCFGLFGVPRGGEDGKAAAFRQNRRGHSYGGGSTTYEDRFARLSVESDGE